MTQFIDGNLEDDIKARLQVRADRNGRSLEEEVLRILRNAVKDENKKVTKLGSRIAARFRNTGLAVNLPELRGQPVRITDS